MKNDRRRDFRFHPPNIKVTAGNLSLTLLDLGRAGMNIESRGPAPIACGDEYLFRLDDETDSVEVLGQVRWVDFPAADREDATRKRKLSAQGKIKASGKWQTAKRKAKGKTARSKRKLAIGQGKQMAMDR